MSGFDDILDEPEDRAALVADLRRRAEGAGGAAFAAELLERIEDVRFHARRWSAVDVKAHRQAVERIATAAEALHKALWTETSASHRQPAGEPLWIGHKDLLVRLDDDLAGLSALAAKHRAELPRTKPANYLHRFAVQHLAALFKAHDVPVTTSATRAPDGFVYTSLIEGALVLALDVPAATARSILRRASGRI